MRKLFWRVGHIETNQGLWYDEKGNFTGLIHKELSFCMNHLLEMPFDENITGYLSATDSLEDLFKWFSLTDLNNLYPFGYRVMVYEASKFRPYLNHWIIDQKTSINKGDIHASIIQNK